MTLKSMLLFVRTLISCILLFNAFTQITKAQSLSTHEFNKDKSSAQIETEKAPSFEDKDVQRSIQYMLERAQFIRTLAAEHLVYLNSNRQSADIRLMEDAAQVMAFDLVCEDEKIEAKILNNIAADTSFKIAMMAGNSSISDQLAKITATQSIHERMDLVGSIATTVLMFKIGRRRGLFDALISDYGVKRFCAGMQADMRTRYNDLASNLGEAH